MKMKTISLLTMIFSLLTFLGLRAEANPMEKGTPIPEITATDDSGQPVELAKVAAQGYTLVYFYPKADTSGCTAQACSLRDEYEALQERGVRVYGVSTDGVEAQAAFRKKFNLPFSLLADTAKKVIDAFGVPSARGYAKRQAFLFKDGKLVWVDRSASTKEQAADVLKVLAGGEVK